MEDNGYQQIFMKFGFPESAWHSPGLEWKKSGKSRFQDKSRIIIQS